MCSDDEKAKHEASPTLRERPGVPGCRASHSLLLIYCRADKRRSHDT